MSTDTSKRTQSEKIAQIIREKGYIDNFYCVENKITYRLGARIWDLKQDGWEFETKKRGTNFFYYLVSEPVRGVRQLSLV